MTTEELQKIVGNLYLQLNEANTQIQALKQKLAVKEAIEKEQADEQES